MVMYIMLIIVFTLIIFFVPALCMLYLIGANLIF
jgi:hypothetical protein